MNFGFVISGIGHGALLIWAMLDWTPRTAPSEALSEAIPVRLVAPEALEVAAPVLPVLAPSTQEGPSPDPVGAVPAVFTQVRTEGRVQAPSRFRAGIG